MYFHLRFLGPGATTSVLDEQEEPQAYTELGRGGQEDFVKKEARSGLEAP
jgi:hypothetical protein